MTHLKGLIFDLDGTLTLTQALHFQIYSEVFKKLGITYTHEEDILQYAGKGAELTFKGVLASHQISTTPEEIKKYCQEKRALYDELIAKTDIPVVPGIREFLARMKQSGMKMAVASGTQLEAIEVILKKTGMRHYFETIVTSKDVSAPKPSPEIFLKAAEKLELKPEECVVFEDAANGIQAAKAGHIPCIALTTGTSKENLMAAGATLVVKDYTEITDDILFKIHL